MIKKINFIVPLIIYPFDVMVSIAQSDDELKKELLKYKIEWEDDMECQGQGRCILVKNTNQAILRLLNYPISNKDFACLQHEIFHTVTFILHKIGMELVINKSDEAYAYLIGFLTKEIYDKI